MKPLHRICRWTYDGTPHRLRPHSALGCSCLLAGLAGEKYGYSYYGDNIRRRRRIRHGGSSL
eukprot:scaffold300739_cov32-Prasinocladus_malaysianus.AAC.1